MSIDGTFLYGKYKGTLLVATAVDANDQLLPFAYALVPSESKTSWGWFMNCIRQLVTPDRDWCIVSDRSYGILNVMTSDRSRWNDTNSWHRVCARHFGANCAKAFNKRTGDRVKLIAYQSQEIKFTTLMNKLQETAAGAVLWCAETPMEKWALLKDGGRRYRMMTTNVSEVFNSVLKGVRTLPVTAIAELTFFTMRKYFSDRREKSMELRLAGNKWSQKITEKLELRREKSNLHTCDRFHHVNQEWQVTTRSKIINGVERGLHKFTVNLSQRRCTCNKPALEHLPCSHLMAVCAKRGFSYESFVSVYYTIDKQVLTWEPTFNPIPDEVYWDTDVTPNNVTPDESTRKTKKGRPTNSRRTNEMDEAGPSTRKKPTCRNCGGSGHNRRTCSQPSVHAAPEVGDYY